MSPRVRSLILLSLPVIFSIGLSYYLQIYILRNQEDFTLWLTDFGPWVIAVYILLQILTVVIAPLGGFFMVVAMITLFGPGLALILAYLVWTPSYCINFYLAKRFGRPLVEKVVGDDAIKKMDEFVEDEGLLTLILTRLLMAGNFDYLSYGWGLTKMPFYSFLVVNIFAGIPAMILMYFVISSFSNLTYGIIAFYVLTTLLTGTAIFLHYRLKKVTTLKIKKS